MEKKTASTLALLFPSMAMARLVVFFAVNPGGRFHLRELKRRTGLSSASLQNELRRLTGIGALRREAVGARTYFRADEAHPAWRGWMLLIRSSARPSDVLREVLADAPGIASAFVFGSWARGDTRAESDVDLFLLGSDEARAEAGRRLVEAELLLGRELDVIGYDEQELASRLRSGNDFVRGVLAEPKEWVRGGPDTLHLAEAA